MKLWLSEPLTNWTLLQIGPLGRLFLPLGEAIDNCIFEVFFESSLVITPIRTYSANNLGCTNSSLFVQMNQHWYEVMAFRAITSSFTCSFHSAVGLKVRALIDCMQFELRQECGSRGPLQIAVSRNPVLIKRR
jgi:hypothetical protein